MQDHPEFAELIVVEHLFLIRENRVHMLVLSPSLPIPPGWPEKGWSERSVNVQVRRPDATVIEAPAQINMTHFSIHGPVPPGQCWRITIWLTDRLEEDVPVGSTILVPPDVRAAILPE